jgi:hypothetical protein
VVGSLIGVGAIYLLLCALIKVNVFLRICVNSKLYLQLDVSVQSVTSYYEIGSVCFMNNVLYN